MFGKVFSSMYDGTLATRGPWQALVTFQQMIVLADRTGTVDMTAEAIARRTTIPLEIIKIGITALEQPDSESRSPDLDGRRITRLNPDRSWGWRIVNYERYRQIRSADDRREYMAAFMRDKRANEKAAPAPRKPRAQSEASAAVRSATWEAYAAAYEFRHGAAPIRDAKANASIKSFCQSVPAAEAPEVAAFYVQNNNSWYVAKKHPPTMLAADAAKLRTEWVTGQQTTNTEALQADKTAARKNVFLPLVNEAKKREESGE